MKYLKTILTIMILLTPVLLWAQDGPGGGLDDDPGVPIDGGASLLAGAAIAYGVKKLRKKKQNAEHME